jgi:radical SAM/Cys-rich protein
MHPTSPSPAAPTGFEAAVSGGAGQPLRRASLTTLQLNVGLRCDLACHHCHVEAGPKREEAMDERLAERVIGFLAVSPAIDTLDLTGGAPELSPCFRTLVEGARGLGRRVIDRCNLTILTRPGQEGTAAYLAQQGVHVIASLPCTEAETVEAQRGRFVFDRSIEALQRLNALGYAQPGSDLRLDLVYNPLGASLPPAQTELEERYRKELDRDFGIRFDHLLTLANMPIQRFARELSRRGEAEAYQALLVESFNPATVDALMCRTTLSVDWDGRLHDCDFNLALGLPLAGPATLFDLACAADLEGLPIRTDDHCFGCTAGSGSSCGGALLGTATA